jgi:integrase
MIYDDAVSSYQESVQFQRLAANTRRWRELIFPILAEHFAGYQLTEITRPMVIAVRDHHYDSRGRCSTMLSCLKAILNHAYDKGWVKENVAADIGDMPKSIPIARWSPEEVQLFLDTAPRFVEAVMMLALYTGQRRSDLVKMDWDHYQDRTLYVKQQKTGKELHIPVHPNLEDYLKYLKRVQWGDRKPILTNFYGAPWQPDSMRVAVKNHCKKIGLGEKMLHGVRKTTASILAEIGCTPHQIASITGHSLKEVARYTLEVEQKHLAEQAMSKWKRD